MVRCPRCRFRICWSRDIDRRLDSRKREPTSHPGRGLGASSHIADHRLRRSSRRQRSLSAGGHKPRRVPQCTRAQLLSSRRIQGCRRVVRAPGQHGGGADGIADLVEREGEGSARLQLFLPVGLYLPAGVQLTIDRGSVYRIPYVWCLTNACIAADLASPQLIQNNPEHGDGSKTAAGSG